MRPAILLTAFFSHCLAVAGTPIDVEESVPVGGIQQFITIKGKDSSLPLLLFLHGGPGGSVMRYADTFTGKLQEHFIVVHWDQRETGKTLELNPSPLPLSVSLFQEDAHELIRYLLKRFHRDKLYLVAHSWGTVLGFHIAGKYPGLLYAYIPVGPMINQLESERIALTMMKEVATKTSDAKQLQELSRVRIPFQSGEELYYHRKWLLHFAGSRRRLSRSYVEEWSLRWLKVFNEASSQNLAKDLKQVNCPVYFFTGRKDFQTNAAITEKYHELLTAPRKGLFWFEHSAHAVPTSEPDRFQQLIIEKVLPETIKRGATEQTSDEAVRP